MNFMSDRSKKPELFPYRERYLEYMINNGDQSDRYQTMLAELYIDSLFKIQDKEYKQDILMPDLINPKRKKLMDFLDEK